VNFIDPPRIASRRQLTFKRREFCGFGDPIDDVLSRISDAERSKPTFDDSILKRGAWEDLESSRKQTEFETHIRRLTSDSMVLQSPHRDR
jgi:hypothetical protein